MDLRTLLPPPPMETAEAPRTGEAAPARLSDRPAVLAFLRHAGCPFAEATLPAHVGDLPDLAAAVRAAAS